MVVVEGYSQLNYIEFFWRKTETPPKIFFQTGFWAFPFLEHFSVCFVHFLSFFFFFDCWYFDSLLGETSYISVVLFSGFLWLMV
jgi:hypothetical protein